jgi:hypothetical protein
MYPVSVADDSIHPFHFWNFGKIKRDNSSTTIRNGCKSTGGGVAADHRQSAVPVAKKVGSGGEAAAALRSSIWSAISSLRQQNKGDKYSVRQVKQRADRAAGSPHGTELQ